MTVHITSGSSGWGNYVLYGTKEKPRDSDKVELIEGDIGLGDRLCESNNYEESYYKIVLSFDRKVDRETALAVYEDFKKEMFVGFKPDEYHIDTVLHTDTDYDHFHMRIPKQNLKTDTHLQLYMDKIDRPRKELIQDHLSLKYGFEIAREKNREVFKEQAHEHINKWREQHNQKPFDFSNKKGQAEAEAQINGYLSELIKSGLIEKREDITTTLKELGLKIEKENGLDIKKDFAYTTVSNDTGKMRIKGEIHHDRFYEHNAKDRTAQIESNRRITAEREPHQERAERVRRELNKANEKRFKTVTKLFKHSRERAEAEHKQTFKVGELESINTNKPIISNHRVIDRNTNAKTNNEARAVNKREDDRGNRRTVSQISSKRAYLRPTKESLLLQNKLKEIRYARLTREAITRAEKSRTAQRNVIREVEGERRASKEAIQGIRKQRDSLSQRIREYGSKISRTFETIREKALNTINEMKEKLSNFGKLKKDNNLAKLIERMEANTTNKERSSNLDKIKEVDNKQELQAPVKKKSYSRSR